jgi:hypothetical protein
MDVFPEAKTNMRFSEMSEKHPSEAEAHGLFSASCGTTEVVPFQNLGWQQSFFAGCKAPMSSGGFYVRAEAPTYSTGLEPALKGGHL